MKSKQSTDIVAAAPRVATRHWRQRSRIIEATFRSRAAVEFNGEYAWSAQGGVIHWTHRDPGRGHVDGWIKHNGHRYQ